MVWTTPRTDFAFNYIVTEDDMNDIGANLVVLKAPVTDKVEATDDGGPPTTTTTTSTTFVTPTGYSKTITTTGGDVLISFQSGIYYSTATGLIWFDFSVDTVRVGASTNGLAVRTVAATPWYDFISMQYLVQGLSAGSHTFDVKWKISNAAHSGRLFARSQFFVREFS